ncbi:MAG TPA: AAA family ATPase [Actinocrinis sp.]|nr:AAA family ATPase [Actinocrinis sp.]
MAIVPEDEARTPEPQDAVPGLAERARESIRVWIRLRGRGILGAAPFALAAALTAAALSPVAIPLLLGNAALALSGLLGQLGNIGAEHIARVIEDVVAQLRGEARGGQALDETLSGERLQAALTSRLQQELDGPQAAALRAEMAQLLHRVDGVGTALDAAVHSGVEGLSVYIGETLNLLSQTSVEFHALRDDVMSGLTVIQHDLARIEAMQRGHAEQVERVSIQIAELHRQLAVGRGAVRVPPELTAAQSQATATAEGAPDVTPYPGLEAFNEQTAYWFHGREQLIARLVTRLRQRLQGLSMVLVVGASGAGKSSVLRAGLIPGLDTGALAVPGSQRWPREVMKPGQTPLQELAVRLANRLGGDSVEMAAALRQNPNNAVLIMRQVLDFERRRRDGAASDHPEPATRTSRLVLVIDQFEEIFTQCHDGLERQRFVDALCAAAQGKPDDPAPALVVLVLRAGFVEHCTAHPALGPALSDQFIVGPMNIRELREAIEAPARDAGLSVQPGLVETMLTDLEAVTSPDGGATTYDPGKLPLLAHALRETWEGREQGQLTIRAYTAAGGIKGAVAKKADEVYESFDADSKRVARILLEHMVAVRADAEDTRRRMTRSALLTEVAGSDLPTARRVLDRLERERLVTSDQDTVQLAHEALLRHWPALGEWLEEHRDWLRTLQRLTAGAHEWQTGDQHPDLLLHGTQLSAVRAELTEARRGELGRRENEFLRASERRQKRNDRLRLGVAMALTAALVAAVGLGSVAKSNSGAAHRQQTIAQARQLAAEADAHRYTDPEVALLLSVAAYRIAPTDAEAVNSLLSSQSGYFTARLPNVAGAVNAVAYDPAAPLIAAAGQDNAVTLWNSDAAHAGAASPDAGKQSPVATLSGDSSFYALAFDPAGRLLAAAQQDGTTVLWDVATKTRLGTVSAGPDAIDTVAFSPDGSALATAGYAGTVSLWNVSSLKKVAEARVRNGTISSVAFSPDGNALAAACTDGEIRIWQTTDLSARPRELAGHTGLVRSVAFNRAGTLLASGGDDTTVRLWDAKTGGALGVLGGSAGPVRAVAFSPDGTKLASAGEDDVVRLWDVAARGQIGALTGSTNTVAGIAFSPDGHVLVGADTDATIGLWNVAAPQQTGAIATAAVAAAPGSTGLLATSGVNQQTYLWRSSGQRLYAALGSSGGSNAGASAGASAGIAFSPDGRRLATSVAGTGAAVWDTATRRIIRTLAAASPVDAIAIGSTGRGGGKGEAQSSAALGDVIAAGGDDDSIYLWGPGATEPSWSNGLLGGPITTVAFSPDGTLLAAGSQDGTILLIRLSLTGGRLSANVIEQLSGSSGAVESVAFSPDDRTLAGGSADGTVRLWDTRDPNNPTSFTTLFGQSQAVVGVAFSSDGRTLASSAADHTIRLWNVADPKTPSALVTLNGPSDPTAVAFEPGTGTVVGAAADGTALFWDTDAAAVAARICASNPAAAARILTPSLLGGDYPALCP